MNSKKITLVDYGMGNLFSVSRAFESIGAQVQVATTGEELLRAERLVLPGVGAFPDGMAELRAQNLVEPLQEFVKKQRPFMGICLGMQMMLDTGEEFGTHAGLGIIPGKVTLIPGVARDGARLKVPHIGWSPLRFKDKNQSWLKTPLEGFAEGASVYFVHSYQASPTHDAHIMAVTDYGGNEIVGAIGDGPVCGYQFHPERSGKVGLGMLERFLEL